MDITKDIINLINHSLESNMDTLLKINEFLVDGFLNYSNESHDVYQKIMTVLNGYLLQDLPFNQILPDIIYTFKHTLLSYPTYKEGILVGDVITQEMTEDMHVFVLGVNAAELPAIYTDNDFLSDKNKRLLGLFTSYENTHNLRYKITKNMNAINHLYLSYKETTPQGEAFLSFIVDDINRKKSLLNQSINHRRYSLLHDKITLYYVR